MEREYSEDIVTSLKIGSISDAVKFVAAITTTFSKERCLKAGVLVEYKQCLHPVFRVPCLLFPYYDVGGHIQNIQSRYLGKLEKGDKRRFNNCKGNLRDLSTQNNSGNPSGFSLFLCLFLSLSIILSCN